MARRLPSQPPVLPGFSTVHVLGSGGFADVFLYEQNMPRRRVAIKVMISEVVNDQVRQMFQAEANLMAQLSSHPSILTVYQASVSSDGRPYLVMELCSAALSERYRRESIPVADVLRIAVKIGSAIETAHRAGVLHRDIKPSNILLTAYGHPVLSDFGIASTLNESETGESLGLSIPWSAPEVLLDETSGTVRSEVWSFAATIYSLLAGRSPFELAGEQNKSAELIARISRAKVAPTGRDDVPAGLELVLAEAMSRKPESRPATIFDLLGKLRLIESELGLPQTEIEVAMDDWALATVSELEDRTRVRGMAASAAVVPSGVRRRRADSGSFALQSRSSRSSSSFLGCRCARGSDQNPELRQLAQRKGFRALPWLLVVVAVAAIVVGATATVVLVRSNENSIPRVQAIQASMRTGSVQFSWIDPGLKSSDSYQVSTGDGSMSLQSAGNFTENATAGHRICLTVAVNRNGKTGQPEEKCVVFSG